MTMTFAITVNSQEMLVHYNRVGFGGEDIVFDHLEFYSPHMPRRRIPVSETGYRSYFAPRTEIEAAPTVEAYACSVAYAIMAAKDDSSNDAEDHQLSLF